MKRFIQFFVMTLALLAMSQTAGARSTFTIENTSGSTFKITRSDMSKAETIKYYTISLSALAGVHFTKKDGEYTFPVGIDSYSVTVSEKTAGNIAAKYLFAQSSSDRTYRFLVADKNGFEYAHYDRTITYSGYAVTNASPFAVKDVTIQSNEYTADDAGYDENGYKSVASSTYFNQSAPKGYFSTIGAELRMTLSMDAKENDDAYEYLQLLVDNTSSCDNRTGCSNGDPGNISLSRYMAGFEIKRKSKDGEYKTYTFPVLDVANGEGAENPWGYNTSDYKWPLFMHKFNTNCRATDGRIILPTDFNTLVLRLNASGSSGSDEWAAKNVKAHIQAVDATAPTLESITPAGGTYVNGTSCYISLAFSEPVVVTGTPYLNTTWQTFDYLSGSGTNVLTFYLSSINKESGITLQVYSLSMNGGTIKDLAGNAFSGSVSQTFSSVSVQKITLYDDYVSFNGLSGTYPVSSTPAEPKPTIQFYYGTRSTYLTLNFHYTRTYSNNTENDEVPGKGIITITGKSIYTGTVRAEFDTRWATGRVIFKKNHDGSTITMNDQTFTYNVPQALKANIMTRSGYLFIGWNTEADGSGTAYADEEVLTNPSSTGTFTDGGTLTLYAQWSKDVWAELNGADGTSDHPYVITTTEGLDSLAVRVNRGMAYSGKHFVLDNDIAYDPNALDANGENYTAIGNYWYAFGGTFDGQGHTVSGIRIYKDGTDYEDNYLGLFADNLGTIQNVTLADAHITGYVCVGGIVGYNGIGGTIENCHVADNVVIHAVVDNANAHGGIVGDNDGNIYGCTSAAHITANDGVTGCEVFGGIVGENRGTLNYSLALGATVDIGRNEEGGAIAGYAAYQTAFYNYYHGCTVGDETSNIGIGVQLLNGSGTNTTSGDVAGCAEQAYAVTLPEGISVSSDGTVKATYTSYENAPGLTIYTDGIKYNFIRYYKAGTTVTLSGGDLSEIYVLDYTVNGTPIEGNTFEMPAEDVTIAVTVGKSHWSIVNEALAVDGANVVLTRDIKPGDGDIYLLVPSGVTATLDLNGHTIDRNLSSSGCSYEGSAIRVKGTLTLNDSQGGGIITGGNGFDGGGVYVDKYATFTMNGGTLTGNSAYEYGGGVFVHDYATCTLNGVTITDNSGSYGGGGVYVDRSASCTLNGVTITDNSANSDGGGVLVNGNTTLSGLCTIKDNTVGGEPDNVFVYYPLTIGGTLAPATRIGVNVLRNFKQTQVITNGLEGRGSLDNFVCDVEGDQLSLNADGEAVMTLPPVMVPIFFDTGYADGISDLRLTNAEGTEYETEGGNYSVLSGTPVYVRFTLDDAYVLQSVGYVSYNNTQPATLVSVNTGDDGLEFVYTFTVPYTTYGTPVTLTTKEREDTWCYIYDYEDNSATIASYYGIQNINVSLYYRTLYKDGGWNTLCLPFDLDDLTDTPLEGATVKTLASSSFSKGILTLNFTEAESIVAGKPYIVKWESGEDLYSPIFENVTITNYIPTNIETDIVTFVSTYNYISFGWSEENRSVLLMGGDNKLFYPNGQASTWLGACRGYFQLKDGYICGTPSGNSNGIKEFIVNFDEEATGIENSELRIQNEEWYTVDGRRLSGKPAVKGVYINNGKKVFIK